MKYLFVSLELTHEYFSHTFTMEGTIVGEKRAELEGNPPSIDCW